MSNSFSKENHTSPVASILRGGVWFALIAGTFSATPPPQQTQPFTISVDVDLIILHATVQDSKGRTATGLERQDFNLYEDGILQSIQTFEHEDIPITVGLVIDHSGSMKNKIADVTAAAGTFVELSRSDDEMFVVNFNEKVIQATVQHTNKPEDLKRAIANTPTTGQTALFDAALAALTRAQQCCRDKRVLILISDGADNRSTHTLDEVLQKARQTEAIIYAIGISDPDERNTNRGALKKLAHQTGGEAYFPQSLPEVKTICARIAVEIRSQYMIGYRSSNPPQPGEYRSIRLQAQSPAYGKLRARTRAGYTATTAKK